MALNFADLEAKFFFISSEDAVIGFLNFHYLLKDNLSFFFSGMYLDILS